MDLDIFIRQTHFLSLTRRVLFLSSLMEWPMMLPTKFVWILIPRYLTFICSTHLKTGSHFCHFCGNETLWNEKSFFKKNNITFHLLWVFPIIKILNAVDLRISALVETTSFAVLLWHYYYDIMYYYDSYLKSVKKKNEAWWK